MNRRVAVRMIAMLGGKLLCVRLKPYNDVSKTMTNSWCVPGGGLDPGEPLLEGLAREVVEELGVVPQIGNLLYIQQFQYLDTDHLEFFFHVTNAEAFQHIDLAKTTHGQEEIAELSFVDPASTNILPEFLTIENIPAHIAANEPPEIFNFLN